jgi:hypothetical protein
MGSKKPLYTVPAPSTVFEDGGAYFCNGTIRYEYYRGDSLYRSGIGFYRAPAMRNRSEECCTAWHIEGAYDTLVEVEGSSWLEEITAAIPVQLRDRYKPLHHFMIYLDGSGCIEVIAEAWELLPEEIGSWLKTCAN